MALRALAGLESPGAFELLQPFLHHEDPLIVATAIDGICSLFNPEIKDHNDAAIGDRHNAMKLASLELLAMLVSDNDALVGRAARALSFLGCVESVPYLIPLLDIAEGDSLADIAAALGWLEAYDAIPKLVLLLESTDAALVSVVIDALVKLNARMSLPLILRHLDSDSPRVLRAVVDACSRFGSPSLKSTAVEHVYNKLASESEYLSRCQLAAPLFVGSAEHSAIESYLFFAVDPDEDRRRAAIPHALAIPEVHKTVDYAIRGRRMRRGTDRAQVIDEVNSELWCEAVSSPVLGVAPSRLANKFFSQLHRRASSIAASVIRTIHLPECGTTTVQGRQIIIWQNTNSCDISFDSLHVQDDVMLGVRDILGFLEAQCRAGLIVERAFSAWRAHTLDGKTYFEIAKKLDLSTRTAKRDVATIKLLVQEITTDYLGSSSGR